MNYKGKKLNKCTKNEEIITKEGKNKAAAELKK